MYQQIPTKTCTRPLLRTCCVLSTASGLSPPSSPQGPLNLMRHTVTLAHLAIHPLWLRLHEVQITAADATSVTITPLCQIYHVYSGVSTDA